MAAFEILQHLDKLESDGGTNDPKGDHSFLCPACGSNNFKVHIKTGKWGTYGCDCGNTEAGKRKIREALSPAVSPAGAVPSTKPPRPKRHRAWEYFDRDGNFLFTVHRWDDPNSTDRRFKKGRCIRQSFSRASVTDLSRQQWKNAEGQSPSVLQHLAMPYGMVNSKRLLANGAPFTLWVEGEPCVDALHELGLAAISSIGGAGKFDPKRDGPDATGIPADRVVVVPDRDKPGFKHAEAIAEAYPGCQWLFPFPGSPEWNGSCPASGGLDIADWIEQGATQEHILKGIGPRSAPPAEKQEMPDIRDQFLRDAESLKSRLDRGLAQIDAIPDVASRSVALHTLQQDLGLSDKRFLSLVKVLSEAKAPQVSESFDDLMAQDDEDAHALVEDLFPAGLVLIAAEGFAGKSSAAYQIAEAVTNGDKFAGQFQCQQSAALIVQMDESLADAKKKWRRMGLSPAKGQLTIKWKFSPMMFPELRRWIEEKQRKLVVLDSLLTIAGGSISPKDAEFGLLIYRLNELAGELGITIICLHHVVKGNTKRTDITKEDIFGTAYVYNGSSDAWGLWRSTEDGTGDVMFNLRCLKARSGLVDVGTTYEFTGNDEDRRMTFKGMADRTITLNEIHSARDKIVVYLQRSNGAAFSPQQLCQTLQLGSVKYAAKLCGELYDRRATSGIDRKKQATAGGRPGYAYFNAPKALIGGKVEKVPTSQSQQSIGVFHPSPPSTEKGGEASTTSPPFSTPFPPSRDSSEREESEGVEGDFSTNDVSRARDLNTPEWMTA